MSSSKNREPGMQIQGVHGKYELVEKLGQGGNGEVYSVNILDVDESIDPSVEYAIKRLNLTRVFGESERSKRTKRFWREIYNVEQLQDQVQGIIPIYDHATTMSERDTDNWYLMPRAKPYSYGQNADPERILWDAIRVGRTIQQIHNHGMAHRDIKPTNILFYNRQPVISDFGLVWIEGDEHITESGEHIGPVAIRPPELEHIQNTKLQSIDYFFSDVYMFSKTVWILLTGIRNGFKGEYKRGDSRIYLKDILRIPYCLEPLNLMFEKATKYEPLQRCGLEECISLLEEELDIIQERISPQLLKRYMFNESVAESQSKIPSDEKIYKDTIGIISIISQLQGIAYVVILEYEEEYNLGVIQSIEHYGGYNYVLRMNQNPKPSKADSVMILYVGIEHVSINNDKGCSIKIVEPNMSGEDIPNTSNIKAIAQMKYTHVVLSAELTINLFPLT